VVKQEDFSAPDYRADARVELERIGKSLTPTDRRIFLANGYGYSAEEIATRHGTSPVAIRVRLSRGRVKITRVRPRKAIKKLNSSSARLELVA
jgi:DNA-directed RNA polymerase specialized sigma24 family protein